MSGVQYVVVNTYSRLPASEAPLDRSRRHRKVHDWVLFVDVVQGDPNAIEQVSFDLGPSFRPTVFSCSCPIPVRRPNGAQAWRFSTRQQTYASVVASIKLRGAGGSVEHVEHDVVLDEGSYRRKPALRTFRDSRSARPLKMVRLPEEQNFGIELELTSANHVQLEDVAERLSAAAGQVDVASSYSSGRVSSNNWKMVPDSSIVCNMSQPDCNTFELVSPVLKGGNGLVQVSRILREASKIEPKLKVNKSMGFHVHIDVSGLSTSQLVKVCQNFIKYEDVMNEFMPLSRRDSSQECQRFFKSNKRSVAGSTNKQRHASLAACNDIDALAHCMNESNDRYYKLNLQNLVTGRQPTIEFRQHSATMDYQKVGAWVRFCVALVNNSAKLAAPSPFKPSRTVDEKFDALFCYVIKDRALRDYYQKRRTQLASSDDTDHCCSGCATGRSCAGRS